jgi:hypothetical protein
MSILRYILRLWFQCTQRYYPTDASNTEGMVSFAITSSKATTLPECYIAHNYLTANLIRAIQICHKPLRYHYT